MSAARLAVLRTAVRTQPDGEWTTLRVQDLYRAHGIRAPYRATARGDLARVAREGLLALDDTDPTRRVFRTRVRTKGASA